MKQARLAPSRRAVLAGLGGGLGLLIAGCTVKEQDPSPTGGTPAPRVLRLETPAPSGSWDPVEASDLESQRIVRQVYDTLLGLDAATGAPAPGLAESWSVSDDGLVYEFVLREKLAFHDGTALDAEAVALNVRRWAALGGSSDPAIVQVSTLFDTVADPGQKTPTAKPETPSTPTPSPTAQADPTASPSPETTTVSPDPSPEAQLQGADPIDSELSEAPTTLVSVTTSGAKTVRIVLTRRVTPLIQALTHPAFGIVSPQALRKAGVLTSRSAGRGLHRQPAGSGAYQAAVDKDHADVVHLTANAQHYLGAPAIQSVVLTPRTSSARRAWNLVNGESDGFDLVGVDTLKQLYQATMQVLQRDPFSVAYLGLNQANPHLADERVRRAIAHGLDRGALLDGVFITSSKGAQSPLPPSLGVPEPHSPYGHDPAKAKRLLAEAGYSGEAIPFLYPTSVARPYLPAPEKVFSLVSGQLGAIGITIEPIPLSWDEGYFEAVQSGKHAGLHLLGAQGTFRDPENFLGRLFARSNRQLGFDSPELRRRLRVARALPEGEERVAAYGDIVELITIQAPILPLVYPISALALAPGVSSYPVSPVLNEPLRAVTLA